MRMFCMFDLPVESPKERKDYRKFRVNLLKEGFAMVQYSIYMRVCPSREYADRLAKRIEKKAPGQGHIRLLMITEKQYEDMKLIIGTKSNTEKVLGTERLVTL